ncbi:hypothetical protein JCM24511_07275 [Saitozyma sp. JCM 24511]|nr:hypothetical protein JCM24511_07275 [Saitozyma sp. JCM 24511]
MTPSSPREQSASTGTGTTDHLSELDLEVALLRSIPDARPIGRHKHLLVIQLQEEIHRRTGLWMEIPDLWERLGELYDLETLDDMTSQAAKVSQAKVSQARASQARSSEARASRTPQLLHNSELPRAPPTHQPGSLFPSSSPTSPGLVHLLVPSWSRPPPRSPLVILLALAVSSATSRPKFFAAICRLGAICRPASTSSVSSISLPSSPEPLSPLLPPPARLARLSESRSGAASLRPGPSKRRSSGTLSPLSSPSPGPSSASPRKATSNRTSKNSAVTGTGTGRRKTKAKFDDVDEDEDEDVDSTADADAAPQGSARVINSRHFKRCFEIPYLGLRVADRGEEEKWAGMIYGRAKGDGEEVWGGTQEEERKVKLEGEEGQEGNDGDEVKEEDEEEEEEEQGGEEEDEEEEQGGVELEKKGKERGKREAKAEDDESTKPKSKPIKPHTSGSSSRRESGGETTSRRRGRGGSSPLSEDEEQEQEQDGDRGGISGAGKRAAGRRKSTGSAAGAATAGVGASAAKRKRDTQKDRERERERDESEAMEEETRPERRSRRR